MGRRADNFFDFRFVKHFALFQGSGERIEFVALLSEQFSGCASASCRMRETSSSIKRAVSSLNSRCS